MCLDFDRASKSLSFQSMIDREFNIDSDSIGFKPVGCNILRMIAEYWTNGPIATNSRDSLFSSFFQHPKLINLFDFRCERSQID